MTGPRCHCSDYHEYCAVQVFCWRSTRILKIVSTTFALTSYLSPANSDWVSGNSLHVSLHPLHKSCRNMWGACTVAIPLLPDRERLLFLSCNIVPTSSPFDWKFPGYWTVFFWKGSGQSLRLVICLYSHCLQQSSRLSARGALSVTYVVAGTCELAYLV